MKFINLIKSSRFSLPEGTPDFAVSGITQDSRKVKEGFIFVAIKGKDFDGHNFIQQAIRRGAEAIIIQRGRRPSKLKLNRHIRIVRVRNTRSALAILVDRFYGRPSSKLKVIGITGTNGKTTVSYVLEAILECAKLNPAVIGTINYRFNNKIFNAGNTTPGAEQLHCLLAQMQKEGVSHVIAEVSSHALSQDRVAGVNFYAAIFTNLSREHLDYHRSLHSYFSAKSKLFRFLPTGSLAILNSDDRRVRELAKSTEAGVITYGLSGCADLAAGNLDFSIKGASFSLRLSPRFKKRISSKTDRLKLTTPLIGRYNIYNILAAVAFALTEGISMEIIKKAVSNFKAPPGRLEKIDTVSGLTVFIDYAHTDDALANAIGALRPLCKGRLFVVFGCGGNRDRAKRPRMGRIATELADFTVITSDNPRNENPQGIIREIIRGINKTNYKAVINRKQAIKEVLSLAGKDDIILIAGKGHEAYQVFKNRRIHFDDREVVRKCLQLNK